MSHCHAFSYVHQNTANCYRGSSRSPPELPPPTFTASRPRVSLLCLRARKNFWHPEQRRPFVKEKNTNIGSCTIRERMMNKFENQLSCVYTLRLIGPISYPGECDLMVHPRKYSVIFSRMHFVTVVLYNMHQDTKSSRLIAVCKRSFNVL